MSLKTNLLTLTLVAAALAGQAEVLSPSVALGRLGADGPRKLAAFARREPMRTVEANAAPALYVFQTATDGLLVVSAESETPALLGYSEEYLPGAPLPPGLDYMLNCYAREIAALRANPAPAEAAAKTAPMAAIAPICKTRWDQGAPYNARCPIDPSTNERSYTGCVATAMAQVLRVYAYPTQCSGGTVSYRWGSGAQDLTLNYDNITFDWSKMRDSYSAAQSAPEVAKLMQACGYAVSMDYTSQQSGASSSLVPAALYEHFGYDATCVSYQRDWFTLADWQVMLHEELAKGYPIFYGGFSLEGTGHAFVIDGYDGQGLFHVNWGWSGMSDGYFRLTALDPYTQGIGGGTAGYDLAQDALLGLRPGHNTDLNQLPLTFYCNGDLAATVQSADLGSNVTFNIEEGGVYNQTPATLPKVSSALIATSESGETYNMASGGVYSDLPARYGYTSLTVRIPKNMPAGKYTLTPAVYQPDQEKFYPAYFQLGRGIELNAEVRDGKIHFLASDLPQLTASDITVSENLYQGRRFSYAATITNTSDIYYAGTVTLTLTTTKSYTAKAQLGAFIVDLAPGESTTVDITAQLPEDSPLGEYAIVLRDDNGRRASDRTVIRIAENPGQGTPRCISLKCLRADPELVEFQAKIRSTGGLFDESLALVFTKPGQGSSIGYFTTQPMVFEEGVTRTVILRGVFSEGVVGESYNAYMFYYDGSGLAQMGGGYQLPTFTFEATSGIDLPEADEADAEYFDLQGRRVTSPRRGNVYIVRQGDKVTKVCL